MSQILGGSNSTLFHNVGLKKGLAYSIGTTCSSNYNCGELSVGANVPVKRIDEAVDAIFEKMGRMKTELVKEEVVERIKKGVKFGIAQNYETNDGHISAIEYILDEGLIPDVYIKGYNEVTPEKVQEVANKYLPDKEDGKYVLCISDPLKK